MRRYIACISFFIYLVFSQFVIKAWVTTDWSLYSQEDVCMGKKLDNYDSKWSCWKNHTIADIDGVVDVSSYITTVSTYTVHISTHYIVGTNYGLDIRTHVDIPPWDQDIYYTKFLNQQYVGIVLLLL